MKSLQNPAFWCCRFCPLCINNCDFWHKFQQLRFFVVCINDYDFVKLFIFRASVFADSKVVLYSYSICNLMQVTRNRFVFLFIHDLMIFIPCKSFYFALTLVYFLRRCYFVLSMVLVVSMVLLYSSYYSCFFMFFNCFF